MLSRIINTAVGRLQRDAQSEVPYRPGEFGIDAPSASRAPWWLLGVARARAASCAAEDDASPAGRRALMSLI